jgi:hypothetical protein
VTRLPTDIRVPDGHRTVWLATSHHLTPTAPPERKRRKTGP